MQTIQLKIRQSASGAEALCPFCQQWIGPLLNDWLNHLREQHHFYPGFVDTKHTIGVQLP